MLLFTGSILFLNFVCLSCLYDCPRYECESKDYESCARVEFINSIPLVTLNTKFCNYTHEICNIENMLEPKENFYMIGECLNKTNDLSNIEKLPGEPCSLNESCENQQLCTNFVCPGFQKDETCVSTDQCFKGLFCDENINKCIPQLESGELCKSTYDCLNNLVCYLGVCTKYYTQLDRTIIPREKKDMFSHFICQSGFAIKLDDGDYMCITGYYLRNGKKVEEDLVECVPNSKEFNCDIYFDGEVVENYECTCGYNKEGKSYCPVINYKNGKNFELFKIIEENLDCHSLNRELCMFKTESVGREYVNALNTASFEHLTYGAPSCYHQVLNSNKLNSKNLLTLILISIISIIWF